MWLEVMRYGGEYVDSMEYGNHALPHTCTESVQYAKPLPMVASATNYSISALPYNLPSVMRRERCISKFRYYFSINCLIAALETTFYKIFYPRDARTSKPRTVVLRICLLKPRERPSGSHSRGNHHQTLSSPSFSAPTLSPGLSPHLESEAPKPYSPQQAFAKESFKG
jgi:hypothetical protein